MRKIKITVMRVLTFEDVFGDDVPEYYPSSTPSQCGQHRPGEVFIRAGTKCPEGLCNWAYSDIQKEIIQPLPRRRQPLDKRVGGRIRRLHRRHEARPVQDREGGGLA